MSAPGHLMDWLTQGYHDIMENSSDPRTRDWFLIDSPWPTLAICLFYAYFSKVLGPHLMANRKPFDLRNLLIFYNLAQTLFSAWIFYEYLMSGWWGHYSFKCQPVDYSNSDMALRMCRTCWWYYFSKFTEFFDTLFFILRKKTEHVSTLHVVHHGCMPMSVWFGVRFAPGGHSTFFALLNTFVHIVMYFYYMVAAMGPRYQKYIWWKKHLTTFQMVQFIAIMVHQFQLFFRDCDYPKGFVVWISFHGVLFFFLFSDFYKSTYSSAKNRRRNKQAVTEKEDKGACMGLLGGSKTEKIENTYSEVVCPTVKKNCYSHGISNGFLSSANVNNTNHTERSKTK